MYPQSDWRTLRSFRNLSPNTWRDTAVTYKLLQVCVWNLVLRKESVSKVTGWAIDGRDSISGKGRYFQLVTTSRGTLWSTQSSTQWVLNQFYTSAYSTLM